MGIVVIDKSLTVSVGRIQFPRRTVQLGPDPSPQELIGIGPDRRLGLFAGRRVVAALESQPGQFRLHVGMFSRRPQRLDCLLASSHPGPRLGEPHCRRGPLRRTPPGLPSKVL